MHTVEFIPANWLEFSAWNAAHGQRLYAYSRTIDVERRVLDIPVVRERRQAETVESVFKLLDLRQFRGRVA